VKNDRSAEQQLLQEVAGLRQRIAGMEQEQSERGQAESAWRAAKEEWEQSFNALTDDVCILDKTGKILRANKAMRDRFKSLHNDLVGLDYRLVYYETSTPNFCPPWEAVLSGALSVMVETWLPKLEGWFLVSCYPLYDDAGNQWGAASVVKDVTERKRVEEVLRDVAQWTPAGGSAAFFRSLVTYLARALDVEYAFLAQFAGEKNDVLQTLAISAHHEITENEVCRVAETASGKALQGQRCYYPSGVRQRFPQDPLLRKWEIESFIGSPLFNSLGQPVGIIAAMDSKSFRNIRLTESILGVFAVRASAELGRKRMEDALRDSEERYRTIAESTYDLICETSITGSFLYLSPNFKDVLGYNPAELLGQSMFDQMAAEDRTGAIAEFERGIRTEQSGQAVFRYRHKNGAWRWFESTEKAFSTTTGEIRVVVVARDITERKKMEEERLRASKMESIGVLAGGIAHDFNNLLTAIVGYLSLAKMSVNPNDELFQRLADAEKASLRAKSLTQQLLTFAKGGAPVKKTASIGEFLTETAGFVLRGSNVRCEFALPADLPPVDIDEGQMSQVINNLVINAQQAMPAGGIVGIRGEVITIGAERMKLGLPLKEGKYVRILFEDRGEGIPPEHLSKIFDPYFTTKKKGSGLGLATSYSIIKNHKGHISVKSEVGIGTTFAIYLPVSGQDLAKPAIFSDQPRAGRGHVLIMDDEEAICGLMVQILTLSGYQTEVAKDGAEAVALYKKGKESGHPFDAVIMDLTIPGGVDGKEAIKSLIQIDPQVKAIVSSGYANDPVMADFRQYGFSGVVVKPFRMVELTEVLHQVITNSQS
jgi:PAS domain S-box-containing protein